MTATQSNKYSYSHRLEGDNIRLISLLPGEFEDDIRLELWEARLPSHHETAPIAYRLEDIRETLPPGWLVEVNLEGDLFYASNKPDEDIAETTYTHPDPNFNLEDFLVTPVEEELPAPQIPSFEALSYVWGTDTGDAAAHVTERTALSPGGTLRIGRNLEQALRHLRLVDNARTLWVDAVCIDQSSTEEKSTQVARMGSIYKSATRVVVWLGLQGRGRVMGRLRQNGTDVEVTKDGVMYPHPASTFWMQGFMAKRMVRMDADERIGLDNFLSCPWFSRVWTLQEIQLAPEALFYWGRETITWKNLRRALLYVDWVVAVTDSVASQLGIICRSAVQLADFTFRDIMETIRAKQCADPRDKLYGIRGLVHPRISEQITVDYAKPRDEVYRDTFLAYAGLTKSFSLWHGCSAATNLASFASWVPDWSTSLRPDTYFIGNDARASHFCVGDFTYEPPNKLTVAAIHIGTVAEGSVLEVRDEQDLRRATEPVSSFDDDLHALSGVLCLGNSRIESERYAEVMRRFLRVAETDDLPSDEKGFIRELLNLQQDRTLITLERTSSTNVFASVRGDKTAIQAGDEAHVVLGCPVPLLFRPRGDGTSQMVGDCYVKAYMNGEAVLGPLPTPWTAAPSDEGAFAQIPLYKNSETGEQTTDDPRLDGSLDDWEVTGAIFDDGASAIYQRLRHQLKLVKGIRERRIQETSEKRKHVFKRYRNIVTGEEHLGDPRLSVKSLEQRGVDVRHVTLV